MDRTAAIVRIKEDLGFLTGTAIDAVIIRRLQESQRDLESGKTLPRFLLQEHDTLTLAAATHQTNLPTGFIREADDSVLHYTPADSDTPVFLERKYYRDAALANIRRTDETGSPRVYVIRNAVVDFITTADIEYGLTWDWYKAADLLDTDIENAWLEHAPEWLIGEAGGRIAMSLRDKDAISVFAALERKGRAACLGEDVAAELASGPLQMGANL